MGTSKLQLIIELSNKMFNSKLKQVQETFNKASSNMIGKAKALKVEHGKAMGAMTDQFPALQRGLDLLRNKYVLIAGLAAGMGFLVMKSIKTGIQDEMQKTSFEVMLGGKKAAAGLVDEIAEYAKKTPYEKMGLGDAAKMMLGFGIAQDKIMPNLKMLGDIAMGDAQKLDSLALAFAQVSSAGKLQGQDLMQMINAGFNPLQEMSKLTGKSMAELRGEMEKGNISFAMVEAAFKSATAEGGKFHGMADKMSETAGGKLSSMMDSLSGVLLSLFNVIQPLLLPVINGLTWALDNLVPGIQWVVSEFQAGNPVFWGIAIVLGVLVGAMIAYNTYTAIAAYRTAWLAGTTKVQVFWNRLSTVGTWLKIAALWALSTVTGFVATVTNRAALATKLQSVWTGITTGITWAYTAAQWAMNAAMYACPIVWIILLIGALVAAIIWVVKNWDTYVASWKLGWAIVKGVATMFGKSIANAFNMMGYDIKILWNKFKGFFQWIGGAFGNLSRSIKLALSGDLTGAKKALFAPIITDASKEIEKIQTAKNKAYRSYLKEQTAVKKEMRSAAIDYLELQQGKKTKAEKQNDKMQANAKKMGKPEKTKGMPSPNDPSVFDGLGKDGKKKGKGGGAAEQVQKVTGAGQEVKHITVNIDSFVKGGINTANTTLGKMDANQLENWFTEMLMRTIRNLELAQ